MPVATRSPAQVEASRRNGAKSRGPRTPEGKARSALNALTHGMRARTFHLVHGEDQAEADAFFARVRADLAPTGEAELALVEAVAAAWWRMGRADALEADLLEGARHHRPGGGRLAPGVGLAANAGAVRLYAALVRGRAQAEAEVRRSLDLLLRLRRADAAGLLPRPTGADEPEALAPIEPEPAANANEPAEAETPDEPGAPAEPAPNEPGAGPVDDLTAGRARLALYRVMLADDERTGAAYWERLTPEQRSTVHLAAEAEAAGPPSAA